MKNSQLLINLILGAAVVALFVIHFSGSGSPENKKPATQENTSITEGDSTGSDEPIIATTPEEEMAVLADAPRGSIVFVNTDTLLARYKWFRKVQGDLQAKGRKLESELEGKMRALESEYMDAREKVQTGAVSQTLAKEMEGNLMKKQQQIAQYKEEQGMKLMTQEKELAEKLQKQIKEYLKVYAAEKGYKYVLGYTTPGGILYGDPALDITPQVVKGLNEKK